MGFSNGSPSAARQNRVPAASGFINVWLNRYLKLGASVFVEVTAQKVGRYLRDDHQADDQGNDAHCILVFQFLDIHAQVNAEPAGTDKTQHSGCPEDRVPVVDRNTDPRRLDLRNDTKYVDFDRARSRRPHRFDRAQVDRLSGFPDTDINTGTNNDSGFCGHTRHP